MNWRRYTAEISAEDFQAIQSALAELLDTPVECMATGVTDSSLPSGFVSLALDPATRFLAARWLRDGLCRELFFVHPETKPARIGFSSLSAEGINIPAELEPWLDAAQHQVDNLPSFTTLASLLASQGAYAYDVSARDRQKDADIEYQRQLLDEHSTLLRQTRAQLRDARRQFEQHYSDAAHIEDTEQWDIAQLPEWCAANESSIVVLPRARNGIKKSIYEDPSLIRVALELLAGPYRLYRRAELSREEFEATLTATGLRLAGSAAESVAGAHGDDYFVQWAGRRRFLEFHIAKGGGRDARYCFRVYFCWDAESQRALIGQAPAHLDNSLT